MDEREKRYIFFEGPDIKHITSTNAYDEHLRQVAIESGEALGIKIHKSGTIVVIQGPRFSTKPESRLFSSMGWDVVNMTQYPEGYLALELGIPYVNIALITDYDAGLEGRDDIKPVTYEEVLRVFFNQNKMLVKDLIKYMIERI